ncbi:DUF885 domain-containing protein [Aliiglaciecola sp. 3_MG-2023]|uniref:DUF885 domain-containing protein n=1 Tax=Aliiglaciecola sp. 3_MG-2023 TaxID=3062644 RepID=UPI0026E49061|nr:DUF885 domain-containing protein [Aliiglaciecola sp. 3_MG-2023]MDO6692492.1 DUF885 domain-containing protein [Aliiglaciecola sp. 3_MG-2023]
MKLFKICITTAMTLNLVACFSNPQTPESKQEVKLVLEQQTKQNETAAFLALMDQQTKALLQRTPTMATTLGVSEEYFGGRFNNKLEDYSVESIAKSKALRDSMEADLLKIDRSLLTGTAATTYDVLVNAIGMTKQYEPYLFGGFNPLSIYSPYSITQLTGIHIDLPRALQTEHPLNNKADVEDYLSRLSLLEKAYTDMADVVTLDAKHGVIPPKFAIEGALNVISGMTSAMPAENPLVVVLDNRLKSVAEISDAERADYIERAQKITLEKVYPGYAKLQKALTATLASAQSEPGIWALPNGDKLYELALQNFGAGDMTAEQIHQLGLDEVARIKAEIDILLKSIGYSQGEVIDRVIALSEDPANLYENTDEGRDKLLNDLNLQMREVELLLPNILNTIPKAEVEVRRISIYEQDSSPGGYYTSPNLDGSRPGIFWINLKDTADWPILSLPTLVYHEASPGHHLQVSIAQEIEDMPMIRNMLWFSAYGEGWALYAELLAKELGLYEDDPLGDIGRLQSDLFRSARLVVDTGIHYKKWSRDYAIDWMHKNTGQSVASLTREVERYAVMPGQATSYKLGQIRILELRKLAKEKLGDKFSLPEFNDQILIHGSVNLTVLTDNIHAWIDSKI